MEETAQIAYGVAGELIFFGRAVFLGVILRLCYDPLIVCRKLWHHPRWSICVQDALYWVTASFVMFGLLFSESHGTPRLFAVAGIGLGMLLYHTFQGRRSRRCYTRLCRGIRRHLGKKRLKKQKRVEKGRKIHYHDRK